MRPIIFLSLLLSFIFIVSFSVTTHAQSVDIEQMTALAEKGIVKQQYNLAYTYFKGQEGTPPNKEKAIYWLNKAAQGNDAAVHFKIGRLYEMGEIYPQNDKKAFHHYLQSAEGGDPYGSVNLSVMYLQGIGVEKNTEEGIKWAEKAAKNGFVNAQVNLAIIYNSDDKLIQNKEKALYWFGEAALKGNALAQYELGTDQLIKKNYTQAFDYFDQSVAGGNTNAMIILAMMFEKGLATEQSSEKSLKLLQLAHQQGNKKAARYLKAFRTKNINTTKPETPLMLEKIGSE